MLRFLRVLLQILLPIIAIVITILIAKFFMANATKQVRKSKPPTQQTVEVLTAKSQDYPILVRSQGVIQPSREGVLVAEVTGKIVTVFDHFYNGGFFKKGEVLIQLDKADYENDLVAVKVDLVQANAVIEESQAAVIEAEAKVQESQAAVQEADAAVQEAAAKLVEAQAGIKETLASIKGAEAGVTEAQAAIQIAEVAVQEAKVQVRLTRNEWKMLGNKRKPSALALRIPDLNSKKATLLAKQATLKGKQAALSGKKATLGSKRAALRSKKAFLNSKKATLSSRKALLGSRKAALASKKAALGSKKAAVKAVKARIQKAETTLARTTIRAPYAGRILKKQVAQGQYVSTGMTLASIYALDAVEVRLPLTDLQAAFIQLPKKYQGEKRSHQQPTFTLLVNNPNHRNNKEQAYRWQGKIVRTEGEIDVESRQQFVIGKIDHPYKRQADNRPSLKIGQFVQVEINGITLSNVVVLPRNIVRGEDEVLVISKQNTIERRHLEVLWRDNKVLVIANGVKAGERVSITPLNFASDGMQVRIKGEKRKANGKNKRKKSNKPKEKSAYNLKKNSFFRLASATSISKGS